MFELHGKVQKLEKKHGVVYEFSLFIRGGHREGSLTCSREMLITWRLSFRNVSMLVCCHNDHT